MTTAIKQYFVQSQLTPVRLLQATNLSATYYNGASNNGVGATLTTASASLTVDSVVCANGDRVALIGQTNTYENGIYEVSGVGAAVILTRSYDFQTFDQMVPGFFFNVAAGTVYGGAMFGLVEPQPSVVGTSAITFTDASASPTSVTLANNGLRVLDTNGSHYLQITPGSDLSANRIFTLTTGDAARTLDISAASVTVSAFGATLVDDATKLVALTTLGVKRGTTAAYAGGGTSNAFTAAGIVATDIVVAQILNATNSVAITQAVPTADVLTVRFSADPGAATTVSWVAIATV